MTAIVLYSCGDNAEETSFSYDHQVPAYKVITDSLLVSKGEVVNLKVEVKDNAGLQKLIFSYGDWGVSENIDLKDSSYPKEYTFETSITIPEDSKTEWTETVVMNDGYTYTRTQQYHKLTLLATDINMNPVTIPIYIKVK